MASMNRFPLTLTLSREGRGNIATVTLFLEGRGGIATVTLFLKGRGGIATMTLFLKGRGDNITVCHLYPGFSREGRGDCWVSPVS